MKKPKIDEFFYGPWKIWKTSFLVLPRKRSVPGKKCYRCQKRASQWVLMFFGDVEVWDVFCHAHRIKAKDLPPGTRFVTRDELRMREVMEL
jgi:hypothetical protein